MSDQSQPRFVPLTTKTSSRSRGSSRDHTYDACGRSILHSFHGYDCRRCTRSWCVRRSRLASEDSRTQHCRKPGSTFLSIRQCEGSVHNITAKTAFFAPAWCVLRLCCFRMSRTRHSKPAHGRRPAERAGLQCGACDSLVHCPLGSVCDEEGSGPWFGCVAKTPPRAISDPRCKAMRRVRGARNQIWLVRAASFLFFTQQKEVFYVGYAKRKYRYKAPYKQGGNLPFYSAPLLTHPPPCARWPGTPGS